MKFLYSKSFSKDLDSLQNNSGIKRRLIEFIEDIRSADSLSNLKNVKNIEGYPGYYRIRIGDYRLGVKLEKDTLVLIRFLHRKEIYRRFP